MKSPVKSISAARLRDRLREIATAGVEQKRPEVHAGGGEARVLAATARSHCATSWQPAAVARPFTHGDHRLGRATSFCIITLHEAKSACTSCGGRPRISFRSCPEQNAVPAPVIITTRTASSLASASSSACRRPAAARQRVVLARPVEGEGGDAVLDALRAAPRRGRAASRARSFMAVSSRD
jgi:hypothetical protein